LFVSPELRKNKNIFSFFDSFISGVPAAIHGGSADAGAARARRQHGESVRRHSTRPASCLSQPSAGAVRRAPPLSQAQPAASLGRQALSREKGVQTESSHTTRRAHASRGGAARWQWGRHLWRLSFFASPCTPRARCLSPPAAPQPSCRASVAMRPGGDKKRDCGGCWQSPDPTCAAADTSAGTQHQCAHVRSRESLRQSQ